MPEIDKGKMVRVCITRYGYAEVPFEGLDDNVSLLLLIRFSAPFRAFGRLPGFLGEPFACRTHKKEQVPHRTCPNHLNVETSTADAILKSHQLRQTSLPFGRHDVDLSRVSASITPLRLSVLYTIG